MADVLVQGPLSEPVGVDEAKAQIRVTHNLEDVAINRMVRAARARIENKEAIGQIFVRQSRRLILNQFPSCRKKIEIPKVPVRSIESITYVDSDGDTQIWDSSKYETNLDAFFPQIRPISTESYPATMDTLGAVTVNYIAGRVVGFTANASTDLISAPGHGFSDDDDVLLSNSGGEDGALPAGLAIETVYYVIDATTDTLKLSLAQGGGAVDITDTGTGAHYIGVSEQDLISALLVVMTSYYENRSEIITGTIATPIPDVVFNLCEAHARKRL